MGVMSVCAGYYYLGRVIVPVRWVGRSMRVGHYGLWLCLLLHVVAVSLVRVHAFLPTTASWTTTTTTTTKHTRGFLLAASRRNNIRSHSYSQSQSRTAWRMRRADSSSRSLLATPTEESSSNPIVGGGGFFEKDHDDAHGDNTASMNRTGVVLANKNGNSHSLPASTSVGASTESESESGLPKGRVRSWPDQMTADVLDLGRIPLGQLTSDDMEGISGLMATWARQKSSKGALMVERLLKRVVDDLKEGNTSVHATTRMYTMAMDAWAKSGAKGGAQRAQHIHDTMIDIYNRTKDPHIRPNKVSFNAVMNAWSKSTGMEPDATERVETLLETMLTYWRKDDTNHDQDADHRDDMKPDAVTFSTVIDTYAKNGNENSAARAQELLDMMEELGVQPNVYTYSATITVLARSTDVDSAEKAASLLAHMKSMSKDGHPELKPNVVNYNALLNAYIRSRKPGAAQKAEDILNRMELSVEEGGDDVQPDRLSYFLCINAWGRSSDRNAAARSEQILERMEKWALAPYTNNAHPHMMEPIARSRVQLEVEAYNMVLMAWARNGSGPDAAQRTMEIVQRMTTLANEGFEVVRPNVRSWNPVLNVLGRSREPGAPRQAELILQRMYEMYVAGYTDVRPNGLSFAAVLKAYLRSTGREHGAAQRADDIVRWMEELYMSGQIAEPPNVYHYTIVCTAWAKSQQRIAADRCSQILQHMEQRYEAGCWEAKPNTRTFNAVLDGLSRGRVLEKPEELLDHMLELYKNGDNDARPDCFSFNAVINSWTRKNHLDGGEHAFNVLQKLLKFHREGNLDVKPDSRSFVHILAFYSRRVEPEAPILAERVLDQMMELFKNGHKELEPTAFCFTFIMEAYAKSNNPDGGKHSERLMKQLVKVHDEFGVERLVNNAFVVNKVLKAWSYSGQIDAGQRAEEVLFEMESAYETGNKNMKPLATSYSLVLSSWAKSTLPNKARRAANILRRMEHQYKTGNLSCKPTEEAYSTVINACAFTHGDMDEQLEAFDIAVRTLNEICECAYDSPVSLTYGWFLKACGRLAGSSDVGEHHAKRAFQMSCDAGQVSDFVLAQLRFAVSDDVWKELLGPLEINDDLKHRPQFTDVPLEWRRNVYGRNANVNDKARVHLRNNARRKPESSS